MALSEVYGKSEGKVFRKKKRGPAGILRNVNSVICFIFKLQVRNENCFSVVLNFHTGFAKNVLI